VNRDVIRPIAIFSSAEVLADIKQLAVESVSNNVEISTSEGVPTIGSLVTFEEGVGQEGGTTVPPTSTPGSTETPVKGMTVCRHTPF